MKMIGKWGLALLAACGMNVLSAKVITEDEIYEPYTPDGIPFVVAQVDWNPDSVGNHRAVVKVTETDGKKVAKVVLDWRRPDRNPEQKGVVVVAAATGKKMSHVQATDVTAERGEVTFLPEDGDGVYYVYYMPYKYRKKACDGRYLPDWNDYMAPDVSMGGLCSSSDKIQWAASKVERFESRNRFEFLTQMGNIATQQETDALLKQHPENPVIFTEDRCFPIRLTNRLPVRWVTGHGPSCSFEGTAMLNEYYVWQIGVWAPRKELKNLKVIFSDLKHVLGNCSISQTKMTCFNQEGTSWDGTPLVFDVNVGKGNVQALWCGVQIPENALPGDYKGTVTLTAGNMKPRQIELTIHVAPHLLSDSGDGDLWRMARLRWLNSTIGEDHHVVKPYVGMKVSGKRIQATEKNIVLNDNGLLKSVVVNGKEALARPMSFVVETDKGTIYFQASDLTIRQEADGLVSWISHQAKDGISLECNAKMESDGYVEYKIRVSAFGHTKVKDIRLQTDYSTYASTYMMGVGLAGGLRPLDHVWNWQGPYDSYWMGNTLVGLHVEFRGGTYHGPLLNDYKPAPPAVWTNEGKGKIYVSGGKSAKVVASTGEMILTSQPVSFEFAVNVTPVKPLDTKRQFSMRFCHGKNPELYDQAAEDGANVFNLHHATVLNPVINYPFIVREPLINFIHEQHEKGRKTKLYYTIRELTNHTAEIYALKSLGGEIMAPGEGNGAPWMCEHLVDGFRQAWYTTISGKSYDADAAFVMTPHSRWINYYLEGLRWMLENYEIDGLYMDDVSFDRSVMKRMRKIMEKYGKDCLIDLHSNTDYSKGPANQYTDFFPYLDRLWFGENFRYGEMSPDEWFVTCSGIPFGLMSEMLQNGGNQYLGMVYGSTTRHSYAHPETVWKLWREFGIEDSKMIGYWDEECPVKVLGDDRDVKLTAYVKEGRVLLALGNFSAQEKTVKLSIDWKALKMDCRQVHLTAPAVQNFQPFQNLEVSQSISIKGKQGKLLLLQHK